MRLIDADVLDEVVLDLNTNRNAGITRGEYKIIDSVLFEFPTVDAVPVVRCGECKWWNPIITDHGNYSICAFHAGRMVERNGYCCWGQRREDGDGDV